MVSAELLLLAVGVVLLGVAGGAVLYARRRGARSESPEVLLARGERLEAIRRYRELTGASLADAKRAVEQLAAGRPAPLPAKQLVLREVHDSEIEAQIRSGALIDAITLYREKTGVGLKEAKDAVEAWRNRLRAS
jgi:ribosomal protein L7/L12